MTDYDSRRTMMVDTQIRPSDVTKFPIIDAMLNVARETYVSDDMREAAYAGENIDLGEGRVTLEPRTLAKMLDALDIQPDELVLDIGCGLGYSAAVIARLADAVVGVEQNADMAHEAQSLLSANGADNAAVFEGPLAQGANQHGPYDAIIIQGGVEHLPEVILAQLKDGGRIAALFMQDALGVVRIGYQIGGKVTWRYSFNAAAPILPGFENIPTFVL
ncbi:MAG: protein-L-isoaspartate O-methyltransferase [Halocynthiibacter sp.]